jgi:hypothetical protein
MVFAIGRYDYSDNVVMDTYDVNEIDVYTSWEDANGTVHRSSYRKKLQGQFDMQFANLAEYRQFILEVQANRYPQKGHAAYCHLAVNNLDIDRYAYLYIDYTTIRTMNNNYTKGYLTFTVTVEER